MNEAELIAQRDEIRAQKEFFEFSSMDNVLARRIGRQIVELAESRQLAVTVAVYLGEQLVFHAALPGTTAAHDGWIERKRRTTLLHDTSSLEVAFTSQITGRNPTWLDPQQFSIVGGAVPLRVGGSLVGVAVASGLVDSARADHDLVVESLTMLALPRQISHTRERNDNVG